MILATKREKFCRKLHIIVTAEEGWAKSFVFPRLWFKVFLSILLALLIMAGGGVDFFFKNTVLKYRLHRKEATLQSTLLANNELKMEVARLNQEKEELLANAVNNLNDKSRLVESILNTVGVDVEVQESNENSGGPFTEEAGATPDDLIIRVDRYLETIQSIPLGSPVPGIISSRYGSRVDPLNSRRAFHEGVDIRGRYGSEVRATAAGVVARQGFDKAFGRYIVIDHENGFFTKLAHLKKILTKQTGVRVARGQVVGLLGSSGRSTGPHVHYEIIYQQKAVDPAKFMRIASIIDQDRQQPADNK